MQPSVDFGSIHSIFHSSRLSRRVNVRRVSLRSLERYLICAYSAMVKRGMLKQRDEEEKSLLCLYVGRFEDVQSWLLFLLGLHWIKNNFYIAEGDGVRCLLCSVDSLWCCSDLVLWSKFRNLVFFKKNQVFLATQKKEGNGFLRYIYQLLISRIKMLKGPLFSHPSDVNIYIYYDSHRNISNDHDFVKNRCHQLAVLLDSSAVDTSTWLPTRNLSPKDMI